MWRLMFLIVAASLILVAAGRGGGAISDTQLQVHEPVHQGNLTIFPVTNGAGADTSVYLTLDEGLAQGTVKVGELGALRGAGAMVRPMGRQPQGPRIPVQITIDSARVNELAIQNLSNKPLLLLAGEVVSGGKQDRVVARDRIVPPHSEPIPLGVFCVEPGRWHGLSAEFAAAKTMAHPQLRKEVTEAKDQQKVWAEVAQSRQHVARALAAPPPPAAGAGPGVAGGVPGGVGSGVVGGVMGAVIGSSSSYARTMDAAPVQDKLAELNRSFLQHLPKNTIGVVVAVNGRPVWADFFASPALFERYRVKLLQSYHVEAMRAARGTAAAATLADARDFLRRLEGRQSIEVEPGLYKLVRTDAAGTVTYELESLGPRPLTLHTARMVQ